MTKNKIILISFITILLFTGLFFGKDISNFLSKKIYLTNNDITKEVAQVTENYLTSIPINEYLVLFYNEENCTTCNDYFYEMIAYEKQDSRLAVYKVNLERLESNSIENELFMDPSIPTIVHVKNNEEFYRYMGAFPIEQLPPNANPL